MVPYVNIRTYATPFVVETKQQKAAAVELHRGKQMQSRPGYNTTISISSWRVNVIIIAYVVACVRGYHVT